MEEKSDKKKVSSTAEHGTRKLENQDDFLQHNAWDNVEFSIEQEEAALILIKSQIKNRVNESDKNSFNANPALYWDKFYQANTDKFFKDRHWLSIEFPDLFRVIQDHPKDAVESFSILEIGCGVGNTVFPLLNETRDSNVFVNACDYSSTAIEILKKSSEYDQSRCKAFVYDVTSQSFPDEIKEGSIDVCSCVFVLSALHPDTWEQAVANIYRILKPGGLMVFRDYGRYDMTQLRFKKERFLEDNFYVRGDGTRVYYFTSEEIEKMFDSSRFLVEQNVVDRRMLVNRKRELKMYRIWLQGRFKKI